MGRQKAWKVWMGQPSARGTEWKGGETDVKGGR